MPIVGKPCLHVYLPKWQFDYKNLVPVPYTPVPERGVHIYSTISTNEISRSYCISPYGRKRSSFISHSLSHTHSFSLSLSTCLSVFLSVYLSAYPFLSLSLSFSFSFSFFSSRTLLRVINQQRTLCTPKSQSRYHYNAPPLSRLLVEQLSRGWGRIIVVRHRVFSTSCAYTEWPERAVDIALLLRRPYRSASNLRFQR